MSQEGDEAHTPVGRGRKEGGGGQQARVRWAAHLAPLLLPARCPGVRRARRPGVRRARRHRRPRVRRSGARCRRRRHRRPADLRSKRGEDEQVVGQTPVRWQCRVAV